MTHNDDYGSIMIDLAKRMADHSAIMFGFKDADTILTGTQTMVQANAALTIEKFRAMMKKFDADYVQPVGRIVINALATEASLPPAKNRSARVRKKLLKRFGYHKPAAYRFGDVTVIHPELWRLVESQFKEGKVRCPPSRKNMDFFDPIYRRPFGVEVCGS